MRTAQPAESRTAGAHRRGPHSSESGLPESAAASSGPRQPATPRCAWRQRQPRCGGSRGVEGSGGEGGVLKRGAGAKRRAG